MSLALEARGGEAEVRAQPRLRHAAAAVLAVRIGGAGLALVAQAALAHWLGPAGYGSYAVLWVAALVLGHLAGVGLGQAACRFLPEHRARGEADLARGFLRFAIVVAAAGAGIAALAAAGLLAWLGHGPALAATLACLVVLLTLQDLAEGVARGLGWPVLAVAPVYVLRQGLIAAAALAGLALGGPADPAPALAATAAAVAIAFLLQAVLLARGLRRVLPPGPMIMASRRWASAAAPMALTEATTVGLAFADVLILGLFAAPEVVGIYFFATRLLQMVQFVPYAISAATVQRYSEHRAAENASSLAALVSRISRLSAAGTLAIGALLLGAAPFLLAAMGPGFVEGLPILAVLVISAVVQAGFGPAEDVLSMLGEERLCALLSMASLALAAVLLVVLSSASGAFGAALAMAVAGVVRQAALAMAVRRRLGFRSDCLAGSPA